MTDKPPSPPRPPDSFASFEPAALGQGTRRKSRWSINPLRDEAMASVEGGRLAALEGELMQGLGRKPVKE
jgi:hypothetical protein